MSPSEVTGSVRLLSAYCIRETHPGERMRHAIVARAAHTLGDWGSLSLGTEPLRRLGDARAHNSGRI